jgi:hypothetical protein
LINGGAFDSFRQAAAASFRLLRRNFCPGLTLSARSPISEEKKMGRGLLLWLIGIPLPIILLIWLFGGLH